MKKLLLFVSVYFSMMSIYAQYGYRDSNRIGLTFGINQSVLHTKNFETFSGNGWNGGLSLRGNFYNDWDMVYSIQFSENNFSVATNKLAAIDEKVEYKLSAAQVSLQLSYVLVENHLTFEMGPIIQVNGKMKIDQNKENNIINGTTLLAKDIVDVSKINLYPVVGLTAGFKHLRLNVSYQYGVTNMLGKLNSNNLGYDFKGNMGILNGNVIIFL